MYPAAFDYGAPETLDEALATLAERGDEVKILAGGQSLIPMMKLRLAFPETLMDINRIPGLDYINDANGSLAVGALVRHNDIVRSGSVGAANATVAAAAPWIADPVVRNLGTLAGSLSHHDPEGDWASVMLAIGAEVVLKSSSGERVVAITDFLHGMFETDCQPNEMMVEVRIPKYAGAGGGAYNKLERKVGDYATVGVATHLQLAADGTIAEAGIALTSVAPENLKVTDAEAVLVGQTPTAELFAAAAERAARASEPRSDQRGTAEFKRNLVGVYTRRGLDSAYAQATGA